MMPTRGDSWFVKIHSHSPLLTSIGIGQKGDRHKTSIRKFGNWFFSLECEGETSGGSSRSQISEGRAGAIWKPAGTHKSDGRGLWACGGAKREITNPFILNVDLASSTGHLKINCQTSFEETALLLTVSRQEIGKFCLHLSWSSQLWSQKSWKCLIQILVSQFSTLYNACRSPVLPSPRHAPLHLHLHWNTVLWCSNANYLLLAGLFMPPFDLLGHFKLYFLYG